MLTEQQLHGLYVPVVTPFAASADTLDLESFRRLVGELLGVGINGLVLNGTTGESPTVSQAEVSLLMTEARSLIDAAARAARKAAAAVSREAGAVRGGPGEQGRANAAAHTVPKQALETGGAHTAAAVAPVPLVLGTGTNDTAETVKRTEQAGWLGADAVLVVVPYYNRPSPQGVIAHFRRVAEVGLPVILYEIPHRTGITLDIDTIRAILELDCVIGMKDGTPGVQLVAELSRLGAKPVLCGEDSHLFAALCSGAAGGMLASAHVRTERFVELFRLLAAQRTGEAKRIFDELLPLIRLLFAESNPGPLKWLLARQGVIGADALRLPLTGISSKLQQQLAAYADGAE